MNYDIDEYRRKRKQMLESETLIQKVLRKWDEFYLQWEIYTLTYLFEPWEKWIISILFKESLKT